MIISFSGYEGCGKSTIITDLKKNSKYFVLKESARMIIDASKEFLEDKNDLSYTSMIADMKSLETLYINNIKNVAADRNLIDGLVYLELYKGQHIDNDKFQTYIDRFCQENNTKNMYDTIVLLKHSVDDDHIRENVLNDEDRIYGKDPVQYKKDAKVWEDKFIEICARFKGVAKNLKIIQAYPDNKSVLKEIKTMVSSQKKIKNT